MSQALLKYYERELEFIRRLALDFARQYPAVANRLGLEANVSTDPHIERLIQAFALVAGRIHHKLDDEFPELTDALLGVLYPHYLAPVPSMGVAQFDLDPKLAALPDGFRIERHSRLHTQPVKGVPCRYRTGYPVTLWPLALMDAKLQPPPFTAELSPPRGTEAVLRLVFECQSALPLSELRIGALRLFFSGAGQAAADLYELVFNHTMRVAFRPLDGAARGDASLEFRPGECLRPVGFERDEGLLPYPNPSFLGYRLLTEYFAFPTKFLFLDLGGWRRVAEAGFRRRAEVVLYLDRSLTSLEQSVDASTLRLGCTPIVNLFEHTAEPIHLTQTRHQYPIVPDVAYPLGLEVYSVDEVTGVDPEAGPARHYQPFYSFRHGGSHDTKRVFWHAERKPALREDDRGTDVYLSLTDLDFDPRLPADSTLLVRTTCTNRNLPTLLQQAGDAVTLELEMAAPLARLRCLHPPTSPLRPPLRRGVYWRLISHLSLNHLSLAEGEEGRQALQELLRLYDFSAPEGGQQRALVTQRLIDGITAVRSRRVVGRTGCETASGFARGVEVTLTFDEQKYVGSGVFLFASVLERFLGLYVSINSFSQMVAHTLQREEPLKKWPPRAGELTLL